MKRKSDFDSLRTAIDAGAIASLEDVWRYVTCRDLFKKAGQNCYDPARKRVKNPMLMTLRECDELAAAIGVAAKLMILIRLFPAG